MAYRSSFRNIPNAEIKAIHFSLRTDEETKQQAVVDITNKHTFRNGIPVDGGICDSSMGTTDIFWKCGHCDQKKSHCIGHPGVLNLKYPVIEPTMLKSVIHYAKVICHKCGGFMMGNKRLPPDTKQSLLLSQYAIKMANKKKKSKDLDINININMTCPTCKALHPRISLNPVAKANNNDTILQQTFFGSDGKSVTTRLFNHHLLKSFERVSNETVRILGKPLSSHPKNMISYNIVVPSNVIRPNRKMISGGSSGNNGLTDILHSIVECNNSLPDDPPEIIDIKLGEKYSTLSQHYYNFHLNSIDANTNKKNKTGLSNVNGFKGLLSKKSGIFVKDLEGTRTFECARAPISPNSRLKLNQIGVPFFMCVELYMDIMVGAHNYNDCMIWFKNGKNVYPGCTAIIKANSKDFHSIESINDSIVLEYGDIIRRNYINGDKVLFGRQPSLWDLSFRCLEVVVMMTGFTIRFNPIICVFLNADFDGDECPMFVPSHEVVALEIDSLANVDITGTNHQDGSAICGMFQNSLWAIAKLTQSATVMSDEMAMMAVSIIPSRVHIDPSKKTVTGRELISLIIPKGINMEKDAFMFNRQYPIRYNPDEIRVKIVDGELLSGVLDLSTVGQRRHGTLFHIVTNIYGPRATNDLIYKMQVMCDTFIGHYGSTIHMGDFIIPENVQKTIDIQTDSIINRYQMLFDKKMRGEIIAPIDMTIDQYFEQQSREILSTGDHVNTILASIDTDNNNLFHMIFRCKKGSKQNMSSIMAAVGQQTVTGNRLSHNKWRGSQFYQYFSSDPSAHGFIKSSLSRGLTVDEVLANSEEVRDGLINRQLSTATTGHQNREANKNMEAIVIDPYRRVLRAKKYITQSLYGGQGIDIRNIIYVKLQASFISDSELEKRFHAVPADFGISDSGNTTLNKVLDSEFQRIVDDRALFRFNMLKIEKMYMNPTLMSQTVSVCFDIQNIINFVLNKSDDRADAVIDPIDAINQVTTFTDNVVPYVFTNSHQQRKQTKIPEQHKRAVVASCMVIREYLCVKNMIKLKMSNSGLKTIIDLIFTRYKLSLAVPGLAVGLIASHSLHEMYTQFMLDAHLRAGVGGTDTSDKLRGIELMVARDTSSMKNPKMLLFVKPEYEHDKQRVQEIANNIETVLFKSFVSTESNVDTSLSLGVYFGGEVFGNPTHSFLKDSVVYFDRMKKYADMSVPSDISSYVIRFNFNMYQMISKNMDIQTIVNVLRKHEDKIFIIHGTEIDDSPCIYCYVRLSAFKTNVGHINDLKNIERMIINTPIRGIKGIKSARVKEFQTSIVTPDGSIGYDKIYTIATLGTNLLGIMSLDELDITRCQTDSVHEMENVFGITAGRRKIITEMRTSFDGPAVAHTTIFADEMVFTGSITGMTKKGASMRENDVLPLASYTQPMNVLSEAALNGRVNPIRCASSALILGAEVTNVGTSSAIVITDEDAVVNQITSIEDML